MLKFILTTISVLSGIIAIVEYLGLTNIIPQSYVVIMSISLSLIVCVLSIIAAKQPSVTKSANGNKQTAIGSGNSNSINVQ